MAYLNAKYPFDVWVTPINPAKAAVYDKKTVHFTLNGKWWCTGPFYGGVCEAWIGENGFPVKLGEGGFMAKIHKNGTWEKIQEEEKKTEMEEVEAVIFYQFHSDSHNLGECGYIKRPDDTWLYVQKMPSGTWINQGVMCSFSNGKPGWAKEPPYPATYYPKTGKFELNQNPEEVSGSFKTDYLKAHINSFTTHGNDDIVLVTSTKDNDEMPKKKESKENMYWEDTTIYPVIPGKSYYPDRIYFVWQGKWRTTVPSQKGVEPGYPNIGISTGFPLAADSSKGFLARMYSNWSFEVLPEKKEKKVKLKKGTFTTHNSAMIEIEDVQEKGVVLDINSWFFDRKALREAITFLQLVEKAEWS